MEHVEQKAAASFTLGDVIAQTRNNFPEERYRPRVFHETPHYHLYGIDPSPYTVWVTADGIGTKPDLAERMNDHHDYSKVFETLPADLIAMIDGDTARFGHFLLGVADIIDTNKADPNVSTALAKGLKQQCDLGRFALLTGETAELGYRSSGYGPTRINLNAVGLYLTVPEKLILGKDLAPGQIILGAQETSIRSNGLTKARAILEAAYLQQLNYTSKTGYFLDNLKFHLQSQELPITINTELLRSLNLPNFLSDQMGHDFLEQLLLPWHDFFPDITRQLLDPSTLYGKIINQAQGWVSGEKQVNIVAAAHITGGGIPEKVKRMLEGNGIGAHIETVFPDPSAVKSLLKLAQDLPKPGDLIDDKRACEQWNRGIGMVMVVNSLREADVLSEIGKQYDINIAPIGKITDQPQIEFRGHTWSY